MTATLTPPGSPPKTWRDKLARFKRTLRALDPTVKGLLWSSAAGFVFCGLNAAMRARL